MKKIILFLGILLLGIVAVSSHGVDVTADTMVIANEEEGALVKQIADDNGINISVYKFTSEGEVEHQLEHMLNNSNKRILVVAYQDIANNFLKEHNDLKDRLVVISDVNNDTILQGLNQIVSAPVQADNDSNFALPLLSGIVIGFIIGLASGIFIMKKRSDS